MKLQALIFNSSILTTHRHYHVIIIIIIMSCDTSRRIRLYHILQFLYNKLVKTKVNFYSFLIRKKVQSPLFCNTHSLSVYSQHVKFNPTISNF